jgi:hypothetical protein
MDASTIYINRSVGYVDEIFNSKRLGSTAPTVSITGASNRATVRGMMAISAIAANASDDFGMSRVQFEVDGASIATSTLPPYSITWDSATVADGPHTVTVAATGHKGNSTTSSPITITTNNAVSAIAYYFSNTEVGASDSNNCQSPRFVSGTNGPCLTISKMNSIVFRPGDRIYGKGGDIFTGCIDFTRTNLPNGNQRNHVVLGAYGSGVPTIQPNCTGETGGIRIAAASGVTVQDWACEAVSVPTPRGCIMIQNNSPTRHGGYRFERISARGIQHFKSTRRGGAGSQGSSGGNFFVEGYPGTGGIENIEVLNSTICGASPTSGDDAGRSGFGNGINIFNETWRGNIICNISGGPNDAPKANYPPMGDGLEFNSINTLLAEFNVAHHLGANFAACGGPAGFLTTNVRSATFQFMEAYDVQPTSYIVGLCDMVGFDFDNNTASSIGQYLYSHGNFNSGYLLFSNGAAGWNNNTFRYSISENDSEGGFTGFGALNVTINGGNPALYYYNMTAYNDRVYNGVPFQNPNQAGLGLVISTQPTFSGMVANNIYATKINVYGVCSFVNNSNMGFNPTVVLRNNRYWCMNGSSLDFRWANIGYRSIATFNSATGQDANSTTGDPFWESARPSGTCSWTPGLSNGPQPCPAGYHLSASSPLGTGVNINSTYGINVGTVDYYGNSLSNDISSGFNMGADGAAH